MFDHLRVKRSKIKTIGHDKLVQLGCKFVCEAFPFPFTCFGESHMNTHVIQIHITVTDSLKIVFEYLLWTVQLAVSALSQIIIKVKSTAK